MAPRQDLRGHKFGRLSVLCETSPIIDSRGKTRRRWTCRCECGNVRDVRGEDLMSGNSTSCGCLQKQKAAERFLTHGGSRRSNRMPEYELWVRMRQRCANPNDHKFKDYGGRGIRVCSRWEESFESFFADMGPRPDHRHSIDRIDNDGNYEPGNCRWALPDIQGKNRRTVIWIETEGGPITASEYAHRNGINPKRLYKHMGRHGLAAEEAMAKILSGARFPVRKA